MRYALLCLPAPCVRRLVWQRVRVTNLRQLTSALEQLEKEHSEWIGKLISDEQKALSNDKAALNALRLRAEAESREVAALSKLR